MEIHWPRDAVEWAAWANIAVAIGTTLLSLATVRLARGGQAQLREFRADRAAAAAAKREDELRGWAVELRKVLVHWAGPRLISLPRTPKPRDWRNPMAFWTDLQGQPPCR